jgi:hypothetical protein
MKVKTAKLEGPALDWAVCLALGRTDMRIDPDDGEMMAQDDFGYSTHWNQGGPIIEQEQLSVYPFFIDGTFGGWSSCDPHHLKYDENGAFIEGSDFAQDGPTLLVAAMRCFVAHKLGEEVDIPAELEA